MSQLSKPEPPVLDDGAIETLLAAQGIVLEDTERAEILSLARYFRAQAAVIAGPLPFAAEPLLLHAMWLAQGRSERDR